MAREPVPRGEVLQAAYGVLDKYKMNRSFFVQSDQSTCETLPPILEAIDPTESTVAKKGAVDVNENENINKNNNNVTASKDEKSAIAINNTVVPVAEDKRENDV